MTISTDHLDISQATRNMVANQVRVDVVYTRLDYH